MCIDATRFSPFSHPQVTGHSPAQELGPQQRQNLAVQAVAGSQTITQLAEDHGVSRKFVYQLASKAEQALNDAFTHNPSTDDNVLFYLPVTRAWLRQFTLALVFICHCSIRGVVELLHDLFDYSISVGTVYNILATTITQARRINTEQDLSAVAIGANDEIFQSGWPVLVGADVASTYCYLLSLEEHRDADTWGVRLLELKDRGFAPKATIADAGSGLRAGQAAALPEVPCRGDVFHALKEMQALVRFLNNRAEAALTARSTLEQRHTRRRRRGRRDQRLTYQLTQARLAETKAIALADDVTLLATWLREDIFTVAGPDYADRQALYDFVVAELRNRESLCPHRLGPICRLLANQRDDLLAFAAQLDCDLAALAEEFQVAVATVRAVLSVQALAIEDPQRWPQQAALQQQLRGRFYSLSEAVTEVHRHTVRASSVIENLNSRLRNYFFLRRHLGPDYLVLLQFFLNHRRFLRSEHPERVGKSPAELLTGQAHPHWLEMLGYQRFSRN